MLIYDMQENIDNIVTKIMKTQEWKRRIRRRRETNLSIFDIKEDSFYFKSNKSFDYEMVGSYKVQGNYCSEREYTIFFNLTFIIEKNEKPVPIKYKVFIDNNNHVICEPDVYENSIESVTAEKLEFII